MGSSGGGTTTQVQKTDPPAYVQPFATSYLNRASGLSNQPFQAYTGSNFNVPQGPAPTQAQFTKPAPASGGSIWDQFRSAVQPGVPDQAAYARAMQQYQNTPTQSVDPDAYQAARLAPLTQEQNEGLDLTAARARAGSPVMNEAQNNLQATLRGDYLNADSNPYLKGAVDNALRDVQSRVNTQFAGNNYGGSAHQEWLGRNLAETSLPIYAQNYDQERQRQMQANLFAPQMAQSDYMDLNALLGVGDTRQAINQQGLDVRYDLWNQLQQYPYAQLDVLGNAVAGSPGMQSTSTGPNPYQSNRTANALGGAAAGAGIGASLSSGAAAGSVMGPYGTAIGAGLGLLGGLLL